MPLPDIELGSQNVATIPSSSSSSSQIYGFAPVASKIASDIDKSTTIYRRFDELSARNLLFYQAELAELEEQQREYDEKDRKEQQRKYVEEDKRRRQEEEMECQRDWGAFLRSAEMGKKREKERMELAMRIREVLEKYHAALAAHQTLLNTIPPSSSTVKAMRNWFFNNTTDAKDGFKTTQLWGPSEKTYDDPHDLVALRVPADQDRLSHFVQNNLGIFFQTSTPDNATTYISEQSISHFVAIISTVLAAIMLFGAIISLYIVQNKHALLGMLSSWTVMFAACVGLLTNAKRDQIFGATAAYAAVLVVFVSGNLGSGPSSVGNCVCTPG